MSSTILTIDQICLSPFNVRKRIPSAEDTATLEASILVEGLRVPIDLHRMRGSKTKFGAFAGRRRYFAIKRLVERGALPANWPIAHKIHDVSEAELIEMSITENLLRTDMEAHELYAGVAMAAARGHTAAQIAAALGQNDVRLVERWLRLGQLAPPVFAAFVDGLISKEQAVAYGATANRELQEQIFARLSRHASPRTIREAMKIGDALERRQLAFVGELTYRAAGGRYELDLFADMTEDRGRIEDAGLLLKLVEEKMATVREQIRATTGDPTLRFVPAPPQTDGRTDHQLAITPRRDGDRLKLPAGDVVAHVEIDATGEALVSYWWASRSAKHGGRKDEQPGASFAPVTAPVDATPARPGAAIPREERLSADAMFALGAVRKAILRAALVDDADGGGETGLDYLVFVQARALLDDRRPAGLGMRTIQSDGMERVSTEGFALAQRHVANAPASRITGDALRRLRGERFFTEPDLAQAFGAFIAADLVTKRLAAALVAGMALERSLAADGYAIALHDEVARAIGVDRDDEVRRAYWTPTGDLLDLFPKSPRRALAEGLVDRATYASWGKLASGPLTTAVLTAVTRAGGKGETWVPPLLRFSGPVVSPASTREAVE
ncbi:ParB/RepB/Spo0J family partition protein [Sphingomonas endophytica]|uniref:ParB-like N-terminal domain-containing protein n=1 Tax=Sphingomonas endophytica TaxID=869719 RepID=A0A147I3H1_9SPHN|nr:ParB N-terminal domain-containing protein [Sphingomonas endophytica]KTT72641.1 hypothetical protein NS334_08595 [Sphingomonas endophytica]